MTQNDAISKVVKLLIEIESINEQVKEILDEAKASGLDSAAIKSVASAVVKANVDKLKNKSELILNMIEEYRS